MRVLVVGIPLEHHVGGHFVAAAEELGWQTHVVDVRLAYGRGRAMERLLYHLAGHRPVYLDEFTESVVAACTAFSPAVLLATGIAPITETGLREVARLGVRTVNFLTDDPWNRRNGASFFWKSLRRYDVVATPRRDNVDDLVRHGCRSVKYLPFAYNPRTHFTDNTATPEETQRFQCEVAIIGGADGDRLPIARAIARHGYALNLYGDYWGRDRELAQYDRGAVYGRDLRLAVLHARCHVCMVRRANRDGHAMRSFEFPAMGACLVTEETPEHRELFGPEGESTLYWRDIPTLLCQIKRIITDEVDAARLSAAAQSRIAVGNPHTYRQRILQIVDWAMAVPLTGSHLISSDSGMTIC